MPLALIFRFLSRVLLLLGIVFFRRRVRGGIPVPPSHRTPGVGGSPPPGWLRALLAGTWVSQHAPDVVEGVRLAGVAAALAAFGAAALVLLTAGTTLATLGPRWVGVVLLVLAAFFAAAAVREGIWLRRAVVLRRRKRWVERLEGGGDG